MLRQPALGLSLPALPRPVLRALALPVAPGQVHTTRLHPLQHLHTPLGRRQHGRGFAPACGRGLIQSLPLVGQPLQARHTAALRRHVNGPPVPAVAHLQAGPGLHQPLRHGQVAAIEGPQQRRVAALAVFLGLAQVWRGTGPQKQLHMRHLPPVRGKHEHRRAVVGQQVGVGASAQGLLQRAGVARVLRIQQLCIRWRPGPCRHCAHAGATHLQRTPWRPQRRRQQGSHHEPAPRGARVVTGGVPQRPGRKAAAPVLPGLRDGAPHRVGSIGTPEPRREPHQPPSGMPCIQRVVALLAAPAACRIQQLVHQRLAGLAGKGLHRGPAPGAALYPHTIVVHGQRPAPGGGMQRKRHQHRHHAQPPGGAWQHQALRAHTALQEPFQAQQSQRRPSGPAPYRLRKVQLPGVGRLMHPHTLGPQRGAVVTPGGGLVRQRHRQLLPPSRTAVKPVGGGCRQGRWGRLHLQVVRKLQGTAGPLQLHPPVHTLPRPLRAVGGRVLWQFKTGRQAQATVRGGL